jgi:hypothetical protein
VCLEGNKFSQQSYELGCSKTSDGIPTFDCCETGCAATFVSVSRISIENVQFISGKESKDPKRRKEGKKESTHPPEVISLNALLNLSL